MNTAPRAAAFQGRLDLRHLLRWLRDDGLLASDEAERLAKRFGATGSSLHPLTRLGGAGLVNRLDGQALDSEALSRWLARRAGLAHLKIDPLRVDAGRVAEVMSRAYAESRRALPVAVGPQEVTVATCEPFDRGWVPEIEGHTRKRLKLVVSAPEDIARLTTEFYRVAQNVHVARKSGDTASATHSFEQLVDLKARDPLDANDQGVIQLVDWLWQFAFEQRASDIHLEPRRDTAAVRFRIDGVLHLVHQVPAAVMAAMTARIKLLGRMDVIERQIGRAHV